VDGIRAFLDVLPPQMRDPVLFAIPFFLLLLIVEWTAARKLEDVDGQRAPSGAFHTRDSWASISMGLVSIGTMGAWKFLALLGYAALYAYVAPWHLPSTQWYTWAVAILGVDLLFYTYHRLAHRVRLIWATHQAHHSSQYFNFATALRQKWNNSGEILIWIPLPLLGVPPWMVFASFSINLSTSSGCTPSISISFGDQSNSSSTRRRTTGCTTAWIPNTWTATTAES
jgi:sterol desaturase/sphingolipid hydroxylase (fatty acid hydroxylase superfamily)